MPSSPNQTLLSLLTRQGTFRWGVIAIAALAFNCSIIQAAEPAPNVTDTLEKPLPTVIVNGSIPPETKRLEQIVPAVTMDQEEISKSSNPRLGDALKRLPGVSFGGDINENKDLQFRGLDKGFSRVQLGGVQIPDGGDRREFQMNRLPAGLIKEAAFIRNPTPEYESDGIGGRLTLETLDIPENFSGDLRASVGGRGDEFPFWNSSLMLGGRPTSWLGLMGSGHFYDDPTIKQKEEIKYNAAGVAGKPTYSEEVKDVEATDLFFDIGFFYNGGAVHIKPLYLNMESDKNSISESSGGREIGYEKRTKRTEGVTLASEHHWSDWARQDSSVSFYKSFERTPIKGKDTYKFSGGVLAYDGSEFESQYKEDLTWDFQTKTTMDLKTPFRQQIKFGAAFRSKERNNHLRLFERDDLGVLDELTSPAETYHLKETYGALFLQDQIWLTDTLSLLPGVRVEYVRLEARDAQSPTATQSMTDVNPALHLLYQPNQKLSMHAAVSRTLNRPQFDQLSPYREIEDDEITLGNPELEPARSWNIDLGLDYSRQDLFLGINLFHKEIEGVIERVNTGRVEGAREIYQYENVGDGWLQGIELEQRFGFQWTHQPIFEKLKLWANESVLRSQVQDASGTNRKFVGQPTFIANVGLDYELNRYGTVFTVAGNYVDKINSVESDGSRTTFTAEWSLSASIHQPLGKGFEMFIEAMNLTDEVRVKTKYKTNGSSTREWNTSGRTLLVGMEYRF